MLCLIILATLAYVYWRLAATNTDVRPLERYLEPWEDNQVATRPLQIVHYIQPHEGKSI